MRRRRLSTTWGGDARGGRRRSACAAVVAGLVAVGVPAVAASAQEVAGPPARTAVEQRPIGGGQEASAREATPLGAAPSQRGGGAPAASGLGAARTVMSLGVVLGLAIAAAAVAKRLLRVQGGLAAAVGAGGAAPSGILEVLGRYPIARGQKLILLRLDRRVLLLSHVAPSRLSRGGGFTTLCEIADPDDVASILTKCRDAEGESLAAKFQSLLGRYGGTGGADEVDEEDADPPALRTVRLGPEGDRAELWDDRPMRLVSEPSRDRGEPDAVSAIRRRLEAMRAAWGAGSGAGAGGRA